MCGKWVSDVCWPTLGSKNNNNNNRLSLKCNFIKCELERVYRTDSALFDKSSTLVYGYPDCMR